MEAARIMNQGELDIHPDLVLSASKELYNIVENRKKYDIQRIRAFGQHLDFIARNPDLLKGRLLKLLTKTAHILNPDVTDKEITQAFIVKRLKSRAELFLRDPSTWKKSSLYGAIGFCAALYMEIEHS